MNHSTFATFRRRLAMRWLAAVVITACFATARGLPKNLHVEGIPAIPAEVVSNAAPYAALGGASFRGWHPVRREILVTTRAGGMTQLHRVTVPAGKRAVLTRHAEPVYSGWYQPGTGGLLVFQADKGGDEQYQFHAMDPADTNRAPVLVTDGAARNTGPLWSRDGQWLAYTSTRRNGTHTDVYVVNPAEPGSSRCVMTNASSSWSVADWSADGAKLLLRRGVSDERSEIWSLDVASGARALLTKKGENVYYSRPRFGDGDRAVYVMADDESDFLTITRLDPATGGRRSLTAHIAWDVESFEISRDGRTLAFIVNEDGFGRLRMLDLASGAELPVPDIPGDILSDLAWHGTRREMGFTVNGSQSPSDAYSLDADTGELTRWTVRLRKPAVEQTYAEPELVRVESFDGLVISSFVYRPDARRFPGPRPVIVSIHGGPSSQSRPGFRGSDNYYLNELGIALVYPNVRGSRGYGRAFLARDNVFKREDAVKDIGAVLEWIRRDPGFDAARVGVMGSSYGGFMTLACLAEFNDAFRCGTSRMGITSFATFLRDTSDYRRAARRSEYGDERKAEVREFMERISPLARADRIRAPTLIVQGKNDPRVPASEAEAMRDAVRSGGGVAWYLLATDEGHSFRRKPNVDYLFHATILFFREHLLNGSNLQSPAAGQPEDPK